MAGLPETLLGTNDACHALKKSLRCGLADWIARRASVSVHRFISRSCTTSSLRTSSCQWTWRYGASGTVGCLTPLQNPKGDHSKSATGERV